MNIYSTWVYLEPAKDNCDLWKHEVMYMRQMVKQVDGVGSGKAYVLPSIFQAQRSRAQIESVNHPSSLLPSCSTRPRALPAPRSQPRSPQPAALAADRCGPRAHRPRTAERAVDLHAPCRRHAGRRVRRRPHTPLAAVPRRPHGPGPALPPLSAVTPYK